MASSTAAPAEPSPSLPLPGHCLARPGRTCTRPFRPVPSLYATNHPPMHSARSHRIVCLNVHVAGGSDLGNTLENLAWPGFAGLAACAASPCHPTLRGEDHRDYLAHRLLRDLGRAGGRLIDPEDQAHMHQLLAAPPGVMP